MKKTRIASSLVSLALTLVMATVADAESVATADEAATPSTMTVAAASEGRGHMKKLMLNPYMLIPQLIALGFAPIVLAKLKMMVVSALMINNMALNAAIFMLIRNMVFGPSPIVKYTNHGYDNHHTHHDGGGNYQDDHPPNNVGSNFQHEHHPYHRDGDEDSYQDDHHYHLQRHQGEQPSAQGQEQTNYRRKKTVVVAS